MGLPGDRLRGFERGGEIRVFGDEGLDYATDGW